MGAWGHHNFENDDAAGWAAALAHRDGRQWISVAFAPVLRGEDSDFIDAPAASKALAAAEAVAALAGKPATRIHESVSEWAVRSTLPNVGLIDVAKRVVSRVLDNSELKDLWGESDEFEEWQKVQYALIDRLDEALRSKAPLP